MTDTKRVVSVSLGSSTRDATIETEILGHRVAIERRGMDGDMERAAAAIRELDGKVDAIGLGGTDLFVTAGDRRYYIRDSVRLARNARSTPIVCGAGLKDTLERNVVRSLDADICWRGRKVLMLSATDRYGMAEALTQAGAEVTFGDLIFILGLPIPVRSLGTLRLVTRLFAPVVTNLPIRWLYPTGSSQESSVVGWRARYFDQAEVIAGDFTSSSVTPRRTSHGKTRSDQHHHRRGRGDAAATRPERLITTTPRYRWPQPADQPARGGLRGHRRQSGSVPRGLPGAARAEPAPTGRARTGRLNP